MKIKWVNVQAVLRELYKYFHLYGHMQGFRVRSTGDMWGILSVN